MIKFYKKHFPTLDVIQNLSEQDILISYDVDGKFVCIYQIDQNNYVLLRKSETSYSDLIYAKSYKEFLPVLKEYFKDVV